MKKYAIRLIATLLIMSMTVSNAVQVYAAKPTDVPSDGREEKTVSNVSDVVADFLSKFTEDAPLDSAFGSKVGEYDTEELKNAIWKAIFLNRDSNQVDFGALGIPKEDVETLTAEVVAETNAESAVTYSVGNNSAGEATVMNVEIDPLYEAAYDEIDAGTAQYTQNAVSTASADDGIMILEGDEEGTTESDDAASETTMEDVYAAFNQYQEFIDQNPDYFGITVPYNSVKDDEHLGTGPISSLMAIVSSGETPDENGMTTFDYFVNGYIPPADLIQIIQMFDTGNQLAVNLLGSELLESKDEAMAVIPSGTSNAQKLLLVNDWLGDVATFDMARIMELDAPEPAENAFYQQVVAVLQQQGLDEAGAQELATQLMGLWGGNQFGVLCESMGNTGVCMSYTYAYAYLVQWAFPEVYRTNGNANGEWKTRQELNYIPNPNKVTNEVALVTDEDSDVDSEEGTEEQPCEHTWEENWDWADDYTSAELTLQCSNCEATQSHEATVSEETVKEATCTENGEKKYTAIVTVGEISFDDVKTVEIPMTPHTYENGTCTGCGAEQPIDEHEHVWSDPTWSWSEDFSTVYATFECTAEDCDGNSVVPADVTEETEDATCETDGKTIYTATVTFDEEIYTDSKEVKIDATGHSYGEKPEWTWADDKSTATATFVCQKCNQSQSVDATVSSTSTAKCEEAGETTYTAIAIFNGEEYKDVQTEPTEATGHDYGEDGICKNCGLKELPDYIWDPSVEAMVDYVRISFDTEVTMYGEPQENFTSDHYWNAVKVDGQWYYVDPCYTDIFIECMVRDRVETDGNMNHLYFMFSDTSARSLYEGYYSSIDTLYENVATDTTYENAWFAFAKSPVYKDGSKYYYYYDSTDMIGLMDQMGSYDEGTNNGNNTDMDFSGFGEEDYRLVYHDGSKTDTDNSFVTLVNFVEGTVYDPSSAAMVENEMITELYAEHEAYKEKYPSVDISCDKEGDRLYFNLSNCVLYYDVKTGDVVKLFEYNQVTAERDLSKGLGGSAFSIVKNVEEAETQPEDAIEDTSEDGTEASTLQELSTLTVENNPIASMTIKNGMMYISVGTTVAFISGRESMTEDDSIGYQFEETNYNSEYSTYTQNSSYGSDEINDNDEFMWSANFVDTIQMNHITSGSHTYEEVEVAATCGKNAYTENRCTECGAIEAGSRVEKEGTALEHHYIQFDEQYYTKDDNGEWNTGTCYVCTTCKDAKDELENGDHEGHEYTAEATWNEDYTAATMDVFCESCLDCRYDCAISDETVVIADDMEADVTVQKTTVKNEETGENEYVTVYTAAVVLGEEGKEVEYTATHTESREPDASEKNPFVDVTEEDYFYDAVLWAVEKGITSGVDDTHFGPNKSCTREQVATFLWRMEEQPEPSSLDNPFTDVDEDVYSYNAIIWAYQEGITKGVTEEKFDPTGTVTREQFVTMLYRYVGEPEYDETIENPFVDVDEEVYSYDAIMWAYEKGITTGVDATHFAPEEKCERCQVVEFLYRTSVENGTV